MRNKKFLITLWRDEFDYDGLTSDFSILGGFDNLADAETSLKEMARNMVVEQLNVHPGWYVMDIKGKERPQYDRVNRNNTVLECESFKIGDGSGYNSAYSYLELIELMAKTKVDENLFDLKNCRFEVERYFASLRRK